MRTLRSGAVAFVFESGPVEKRKEKEKKKKGPAWKKFGRANVRDSENLTDAVSLGLFLFLPFLFFFFSFFSLGLFLCGVVESSSSLPLVGTRIARNR